MLRQYRYETRDTDPTRNLVSAARKEAATERLVSDLRDIASLLERSIEQELVASPVRDKNHFAYPISVRTMTSRLNNLRESIRTLERLNQSNADITGCSAA